MKTSSHSIIRPFDYSKISHYSTIRLFDHSKLFPHSIIRLFDYSIISRFHHSRSAFTLLELLVVIGIMGLLGTASVGGYRAMQRGMADRGVLDNVDALVRAAYQRAQIDRQPTVIYFWNETLREETDSQTAIVVGKAVAVRRAGRISDVKGTLLIDEFADLNLTYKSATDTSSLSSDDNTLYLYPVDKLTDITSESSLKRALVSQSVVAESETLQFLSGRDGAFPTRSYLQEIGMDDYIEDGSDSGELTMYGFRCLDSGSVSWQRGMAYGFEFAHLELPHGYIFGSGYSQKQSSPIKVCGTLVFRPGLIRGNGVEGQTGIVGNKNGVVVYSLRPDSSGGISAQRVGKSTDPTQTLY